MESGCDNSHNIIFNKMSKLIYKFKLRVTDSQEVLMPAGAEILTIQTQFREPCIWVMFDESELKTEYRRIEMIGTGNPINDTYGIAERKYISTFQMDDGRLVFHCFELI